MHRVAELRRRRRIGVVRPEVGVVGLVAVGAPIPLEGAAVGVEHDDPLVQIAVGDVGLVLTRVHEDLGDAAEAGGVVAVAGERGHALGVGRPLARVGAADLQQELAALGELEQLRVAVAVAADPDVALVVDGDAVIRGRPLEAFARAAPVIEEIPRLIELQHRRRAGAALPRRRLQLEPLLVVAERGRAAMNDPHVVVLVHRDADRGSEHPVIGQRFGPQRIHLEGRRQRRAAGGRGHVAREIQVRGAEADEHHDEKRRR